MKTAPAAAARRNDRRRQRTRSAILTAGQKLFAARAMEGVTIDDIIAEADVAKGSFYNHFEDKERLADAVLEFVHQDCELHISSVNRGIGDPAARLARALCVMIGYAADHPDRLKALISLSERRRSATSLLNAGAASDIADGVASGRFADVTVAVGLVVATSLISAAVMNGEIQPVMIAAAMLRALGVSQREAAVLADAAAADLLKETG